MSRRRDLTIELKILAYLYHERRTYAKRTQNKILKNFNSRPRANYALGFLVGSGLINEKTYSPAYLYEITDTGIEALKSKTPEEFLQTVAVHMV